MSVNLNPVPAVVTAESLSPNPAPKPVSKAVSKSSAAPTSSSPQASSQPVPLANLSPNVTFRRDANGQVYYVLTDSHSGKELREVPSATIRSASQGIADFLNEEESRANSHIEVKA